MPKVKVLKSLQEARRTLLLLERMIKIIPRRVGQEDVKIISHPTKTYRLQFDQNRIRKNVDGLQAMEQFVYKVINTERYNYLIYNWNYGIELKDLIGKPTIFAKAEIPRRITESLITDDRVLNVKDFNFRNTNSKTLVAVDFTVETIYGNVTGGREINIQ